MEIVPDHGNKDSGFSFYATHSWNKLSEVLRPAPTLTTFKVKNLYVHLRFLLNYNGIVFVIFSFYPNVFHAFL